MGKAWRTFFLHHQLIFAVRGLNESTNCFDESRELAKVIFYNVTFSIFTKTFYLYFKNQLIFFVKYLPPGRSLLRDGRRWRDPLPGRGGGLPEGGGGGERAWYKGEKPSIPKNEFFFDGCSSCLMFHCIIRFFRQLK